MLLMDGNSRTYIGTSKRPFLSVCASFSEQDSPPSPKQQAPTPCSRRFPPSQQSPTLLSQPARSFPLALVSSSELHSSSKL
eukprot:scaffold2849_cov203-Alexandrium_tamarense.AAC.24